MAVTTKKSKPHSSAKVDEWVLSKNETNIIVKRYLSGLIMLFNFILVGYSQNENMLVFIGEKIKFSKDTVFDDFPGINGFGPDKYIITYKIVKLLSGNPEKDTISCFTSDEWETPPALTKYEHALLFLYKWFDGYYCRDDIDVYRTKDNRWATASYYCKEGYEYLYKGIDKPQKVSFEKEVSFDISKYNDEYIKKHYPSPYFEVKENKAIAIYGHYLDDLLKFKKVTLDTTGFSH